jgi:hypothetical protein
LTLRPVTALLLSWATPTEFFGKIRLPAAWPSGVETETAITRAVAARRVLGFGLNIGFPLESIVRPGSRSGYYAAIVLTGRVSPGSRRPGVGFPTGADLDSTSSLGGRRRRSPGRA